MKHFLTYISVPLNSLMIKIVSDERDTSQFLVEKILNETDSKLREKVNFTVHIWSIFALTKNPVHNTFRKNSSVRLNGNLIKII
jgi:hypothetical protein